MLFTDNHPDARHLLVLDPQGRRVGRILSIDLATGEVLRYATDPVSGKVLTRKAHPLQQGLLPREVVTETVTLPGHTLYHRLEGRALGVTPGAAGCELTPQLLMQLAPMYVTEKVVLADEPARFAEVKTCISPTSFCPSTPCPTASTCFKNPACA